LLQAFTCHAIVFAWQGNGALHKQPQGNAAMQTQSNTAQLPSNTAPMQAHPNAAKHNLPATALAHFALAMARDDDDDRGPNPAYDCTVALQVLHLPCGNFAVAATWQGKACYADNYGLMVYPAGF
jgi:hypothetical protein